MTQGTQYAQGSMAWGICQRCGLRALLNDLVFDEYYRDLRVHPECKDLRHPQERLPVVSDPVTLWKPSPEQSPLHPVLTGEITGVLTSTLNWTEADRYGGTRIESYVLYRRAGASAYGLIATLPVIYSDLFLPTVVTLEYEDDSLSGGVTYTYYVVALDSYGRELESNEVVLVTPVDVSVTPNAGSLTFTGNAPALTVPAAEGAIGFGGSMYYKAPNPGNQTNYTITAWVRRSNESIEARVFDQSNMDVRMLTTGVLSLITAEATSNTTDSPNENEWIFVSFRYWETGPVALASWMRLSDTSVPVGQRVSHVGESAPYSIGFTELGRNLIGAMCQVRQWSVLLSDAELIAEKDSATAVRSSGLLASNNMTTTTDLTDQSGNGRTLTISGSGATTVAGPGNE